MNNYSLFNTSTLGYKLLSGQLRERRKHSEQLNKYLAGLMDSDGCLSLKISPDRTPGLYRLYLCMSLGQSESVDADFEVLTALKDYYGYGSVYTRDVPGGMHKSRVGEWKLAHKDSLIIYNRIGKHLRVKGTHWDNLTWVVQQLDRVLLTKDQVVEIQEFSKCSRKNSRWLKHPKHLSWAWVAGFLDGDGHYRFRTRSTDTSCHNEAYVTFNCAESDRFIADFFKVCFKGNVYQNAKKLIIWKRNLGKSDKSFSIDFLKKLRQYSCLAYKYKVIDSILNHYSHQASETKQCDSES